MAHNERKPVRRKGLRNAAATDLGFEPRRVGLVLGGGAVRGAAHIGALQALSGVGFAPDLVVGTSSGALIGALYAAGIQMDDVATAFNSLHWRDLTRLARPRQLGLLSTDRMRELMAGFIGAVTFEELPTALATVACDITARRRVVITSGSVLDAVMASSAIPGLFVPLEYGDAILVDGAVVDNLPVDVARSLGADYIVAVDVIPRSDEPRRPEDLRDILLTAFEMMQRSTERAGRFADCYISPDIGGFSISDFSEAEELRRRGYEAAMRAAPQLRQDLGLAEEDATATGQPTKSVKTVAR